MCAAAAGFHSPHLGLRSSSPVHPRMDRNYGELDELLLTIYGKNIDSLSTEQARYIQFAPDEMAERKVVVCNGKVCLGNGSSILSTIIEAGIMVVMFDDGEIYASYSIAESVFHSSLDLPNKKRIAVGNLKVFNGELTHADDLSGHFAPPPERINYLISELIHHKKASYSHNFSIKYCKFSSVSRERRISQNERSRKVSPCFENQSSSPTAATSVSPESASPSQRARRLSSELHNWSLSSSSSGSNTPSPRLRHRRVTSIQAESIACRDFPSATLDFLMMSQKIQNLAVFDEKSNTLAHEK